MADRLTFGRPVREGYAQVDGEERTVWLEHVWNTGKRTRSIVEPGLVEAPICKRERELPDIRNQYRCQPE